jgi:Protein of unknown function (DUF3147)
MAGCRPRDPRNHVTIGIDLSGLRKISWYEYAIRFIFGGLTTVAAGLIAHHYGPKVGGLFLAFPAIFPASATLVEKHEAQKKKRSGLSGVVRGCEAAALDAAGAALGCIGLVAFAIVVWQLLLSFSPAFVFAAATASWLAASVLGWKTHREL